jgi:hypothetical protein
MRNITFLVIGPAAGTFAGTMLDSSVFAGSGHTGGHQMGMTPYENLSDDRKNIWPSDLPTPTLGLDLQPDPASGHNLFVTMDGFQMTPEDVNKAVEPGTGHGHLFVSGENIGRLYADMRHMIDLPKGDVTIHMYLGGNDHKVWVADGQPLFVERTFLIE